MDAMTRIEKLKRARLSNNELTGWVEVERLRMESYLETEREPYVIKRAKMLDKVLSEMPISIEDGDLIAGSQDNAYAKSCGVYKSEKECPVEEFEGYQGYKAYQEFFSGLAYIDEKTAKIRDFWVNEEYLKRADALFTEEEKNASKELVLSVEAVTAHIAANHALVLKIGLNGIMDIAKKRMLAAKGNQGKQDFYKSVLISCVASFTSGLS